MKFSEFEVGDKVRLFRGESSSPSVEVIGTITRVHPQGQYDAARICIDGIDRQFYENLGAISLVERPWKAPTQPGLYQSKGALHINGRGTHDVPIYRLSSINMFWYVAQSGHSSLWRRIGKDELPKDIIALVPEKDVEHEDEC